MRGLIGPVFRRLAAIAVAPLLVAIAIPFVASTATAEAPTPSKDALPPVDVWPSKDAVPFPADAHKLDAGKSDATADANGDAGKKPDAAPRDTGAPRPVPPDPTPLAAEAVFILTVRYEKGQVTLVKTKREKLPIKAALPRHMGRFAAELYVADTLLERLRFDFPLISDDSNIGETYAKGLDVRVDVKIPDSDRPTRLEIWDRATDRRWVLPYPPKID